MFIATSATPVRRWRISFGLLILLSAGVMAGMIMAAKPWTYGNNSGSSIYGQTFLVGSTTQSLVEGHGMVTCTTAMGTPGNPICFRAARMPVASVTLAAGVLAFGDRPELLVWLKNLLYLIPYWAAAGIVLWRARNHFAFWGCWLLALLPMLLPNYLGIIVNVDAEECYLFGFLALAIVLVFLRLQPTMGWALTTGATLSMLFLCKSSMLPAVLVLGIAALLQTRRNAQRAALLLLLCVGPAAWAIRQHHVSGRFSLGTSLDGLNFHKGNNAHFQERYPIVNTLLDQYDFELNRGVHFDNEWQYNDYHLKQGLRFAADHPAYTLRSVAIKANVMLFTLNRMASHSYGTLGTLIVTSGMIVFRLLLWASLLCALWSITGRLLGRQNGFAYLFFVGAYCVPYLAGFGYIRHDIMLAGPAAFLCAGALLTRSPMKQITDAV